MINTKANYTLSGNQLRQAAEALSLNNCPITAMKLIRAATGCALKDARDYVENQCRPILDEGDIVSSETGRNFTILARTKLNGRLFYWVKTTIGIEEKETTCTFSPEKLREVAPLGWEN